MNRGRWLRDRSGQGLDIVVVGLALIIMFWLLWAGITDVVRISMVKQHMVQAVIASERQAMTQATADPDLAQGGANLNPGLAQQVFDTTLPSVLNWPPGTYSVQTVQVFTQSETGQALPSGMNGTIAGPGLYVAVTFSVNLVPFGNPQDRTGYTIPVTVQVVESANRFNHPQVKWTPG